MSTSAGEYRGQIEEIIAAAREEHQFSEERGEEAGKGVELAQLRKEDIQRAGVELAGVLSRLRDIYGQLDTDKGEIDTELSKTNNAKELSESLITRTQAVLGESGHDAASAAIGNFEAAAGNHADSEGMISAASESWARSAEIVAAAIGGLETVIGELDEADNPFTSAQTAFQGAAQNGMAATGYIGAGIENLEQYVGGV